MLGEPLEVISVDNNVLTFHRDVLQQVLDKCGNRPLVIYSVAGEYRKGKSFLLNLFLLFNHHHQNGEDWMVKASGVIGGFEASGGCERITSGIWIWSEPILSKTRNNTDIAILLMDTQGTFDRDTTSAVNAFIFGFSIAVSSVMMYNVKDHINEQDLDNLVTFAQSIQHLAGSFQSLKFIVRDWLDTKKYDHGSVGGGLMVKNIFDTRNAGQRQQIRSREAIKGLFQSITAFLLPLPGVRIFDSKSNPVRVEDMTIGFRTNIDELCKELFVENISIRETMEGQWTAKTFKERFVEMDTAYTTGKVVDPGTLQEALGNKIAFAINQYAYYEYMERIEKEMFKNQNETKQNFVNAEFLKNLNKVYREKAAEAFTEKVKNFGKFEKALELLLRNIDKWFKEKESVNNLRINRFNRLDEERKVRIERAELEMDKEELRIDKEAHNERRKPSKARALELEKARQRLKIRREEHNKRLMDEGMEWNHIQNCEFERNQRQSKERIQDTEKKKLWWEKVFESLKTAWQLFIRSFGLK